MRTDDLSVIYFFQFVLFQSACGGLIVVTCMDRGNYDRDQCNNSQYG